MRCVRARVPCSCARADARMIYRADTATPAEERERSEENNVVDEAGSTGSLLS